MRWLAAAALCAALLAGPARVYEIIFPTPDVPGAWPVLLTELRAFEQRLGFRETPNFKVSIEAHGTHTICGYVPPFKLPYSYQDPLIRWSDATTRQDCQAGAEGHDVYFAKVEAVGEVATAINQTMTAGKLDRFLYLVIHEDCHDQFDFPYGFEEALCNVLGYEGLTQFAREKYGAWTRENHAARRYAETQSQLTHAVVGYYRQVEALYARHARGEIAAAAALIERARVFGGAERTLGWYGRTMNNVGLANEMTYSRHFPLIEQVHAALGRDLIKTVAFFKAVDQARPAAEAIMTIERISDERSVHFVRAYEAALVDIVKKHLADNLNRAATGRLK